MIKINDRQHVKVTDNKLNSVSLKKMSASVLRSIKDVSMTFFQRDPLIQTPG